jgi:Ca2+-transporting ATPase
VYAVEQGRKLFDNLTKYIRFVLLLLVAFVTTFLGAAIFNIAAGEPFTAGQALWIHFVVNAPFGIALGFDRETPGLMNLRPKPRGESVVTGRVLLACGLVGLFMAAANLLIIQLGKSHYDDVAAGQSMALTAFTLMLVVAAFQSRSERGTIFTTETFNSRQLNWTALAEIAGAWLITQADFLQRLLDTTDLSTQQFGIAVLAAVVLLLAWEGAKWVARSRAGSGRRGARAPDASG